MVAIILFKTVCLERGGREEGRDTYIHTYIDLYSEFALLLLYLGLARARPELVVNSTKRHAYVGLPAGCYPKLALVTVVPQGTVGGIKTVTFLFRTVPHSVPISRAQAIN